MQIVSFVFGSFWILLLLSQCVICKIVKSDNLAVNISNGVLLIASYAFVIYADYRFGIVLAILTLSTYLFAISKKYIMGGIWVAVISLAFFKYTNFFAQSFEKIIGQDTTTLNIILPIGISFYSFSAISYLIDVKREKVVPRGLKELALYLSFFPKITSGPIQRSEDFFEQIEVKRNINWYNFSCGIQIFMFGLFKKIVLADRLSVFVNQVYETPMAYGSITIFFAVIAYSLQIYFDFSGYSDMAIGISKTFGIDLPRNFNLPYLSHNVTEFWKRWHITLSSWLQEYVYISMGGNKKGKIRTYMNLLLTMVIGGIWHGANWTYVVWGLFHGMALVVHKLFMKITNSTLKKHNLIENIFSILLTFLFTSFGWIFFRAESIGHAFIIIKRLLGMNRGLEQPYFWLFVAIIILMIANCFAWAKSKETKVQKKNVSFINGYYPLLDLTNFLQLIIFFVFGGMILCFAYTGGSPFIYGNY